MKVLLQTNQSTDLESKISFLGKHLPGRTFQT